MLSKLDIISFFLIIGFFIPPVLVIWFNCVGILLDEIKDFLR